MPQAKLPTTLKGWLIAVVASLVGFFAGFATVSFLTRKM